jgi:DNA-binding CsgD family transcriptional regulator
MEVGEIERSLEIATRAATTAREVGAARDEALALGTIGSDLIALGRVSEGLDHLRAVALRQIELGQPLGIAVAFERLTEALVESARYEEAVSIGRQGLELARQMGLERSFAPFVAASLAGALERLGRWDEASSLCRDTADGLMATSARQRLAIVAARIAIRRGLLAGADAVLAALAEDPADDDVRLAVEAVRVERAVIVGDLSGSIVSDVHAELRGGARWHATIGDLECALARADADAAERARALRDEAGREDAARWARGRATTLERFVRDATPEMTALVEPYQLLAGAEAARARALRRGNTERWSEARRAWEARRVPYVVAYAALREAESLLAADGSRAEAAGLVRGALATSVALGAAPLRTELESLARRARLTVKPADPAEPVVPAVVGPAEALGLTAREREVLGYVAAGWTNRQIAAELFISPKTASVHVSHILDKLGVDGRVHAATIGVRLGFGDGVPAEPEEATSRRRAR